MSSSGSSAAQAPSASSASPDSTTPNATPSTSPTTPSTPTTTPQSSPAQTSSAANKTTSSLDTTTSSSAAPTTSTSSFTSQVATTFSSTNPAGSVVYVTSAVPVVVTTSISSGASHNSSSNTGVIVGAVVGGVAGIAILALLLFCIRRRARSDEFDGNFDPDRVVGHADSGGGTLPHVDLADEVSPFPQSQPYTDQGSLSMRQYGKSPYIAMPSSLGHASTEFYPSESVGAGTSTIDAQPRTFMHPGAGSPPPSSYVPPINMYGTGPADWHSPRPGASPPPSTVSYNTTSTRIAKEREAMGRGGQGVGLGLATQQEAPEGAGDVVVHQDAGRAPIEEHAPPREIPPAYDSIRQD